MSPLWIVLIVLVIITASFGMYKLKEGLHGWLNRKGLYGVAVLVVAGLFAWLASTEPGDQFRRWLLAGMLGLIGIGIVVLERAQFLREHLTVYHIYAALIVFGIAFAAAGWFLADAARWVMVGLGLLVAAVPSAIWISLRRARKQDARDWPLDRDNR